jgi:hypothetical protein
MKPENIGSSLDEFLAEEGILEEATARARKKALAWQLERTMTRQGRVRRSGSPLSTVRE